MIGKLRGKLDSVGEDFIILDVNGVGYLVSCATRTLQNLVAGKEIALAIETQVREDSIRLYGFLSEAERDWFRLLQSVQGVGAKVALALLGVLGTPGLATALARQDKATLARTPGVGPRLAARLVSELKDKLPGQPEADAAAPFSAPPETAAVQDAIAALVGLDYSRQQATNAVAAAAAALGDGAETAALIRRGLKELSR